jgi:Cu+-exporting ATPase
MSEFISEHMEDQGVYSLVTDKTELSLIGMTCANCAMNIEKAINLKIKGIVDVSVSFATERAFVEFVPAISSTDDIIAAIKRAGYGAISADEIMDG